MTKSTISVPSHLTGKFKDVSGDSDEPEHAVDRPCASPKTETVVAENKPKRG